ncbi:MAG: proline--tRNA ligase [Spiroplasma sp.]|nr:proline--tRNA ligase [Spiroplasma sp.]
MAKNFNQNITLRTVDFAKWYTSVIKEADLCDYGDDNGSTKGTIIFRPYGYAIWETIQKILNQKFLYLGIENVMFPLLITEKTFTLEKDHIKGFAPECAIVTQVGSKKLVEPFIIRPTSEVLFCRHFQRIVNSYKNLPILYNQWCNVIRWEKTTRPFLRNSEFLWQEGHTAHGDSKEALAFAKTMIQVYANFVEEFLAIKVILGRKTIHERFAGALETYTIETMMQDGQALQAGTSHYFGQKFAEIFNIKFTNDVNQQKYIHQTSFGVSTRLIGALIMAHSDDFGLVLPASIAPIKIIILNLFPRDIKVTKLVNNLSQIFNKEYKTQVDDSDKSTSYKRSAATIKGIPLIIEVGQQELEKSIIKVTSRVNLKSIFLKIVDEKKMLAEISKFLNTTKTDLLKISANNFTKNLQEITDFKKYQKLVKTHKGYFIAPFCGDYDCEAQIKTLTNTTSRCVPLVEYKANSTCFKCHKPNAPWTYFARSY